MAEGDRQDQLALGCSTADLALVQRALARGANPSEPGYIDTAWGRSMAVPRANASDATSPKACGL